MSARKRFGLTLLGASVLVSCGGPGEDSLATEPSAEPGDTAVDPGSDPGSDPDPPPHCPDGDVSWDLVEARDLGVLATWFAGARLKDTDGDGDVDAADRMFLILGHDDVQLIDTSSFGRLELLSEQSSATVRLADLDDQHGADVAALWQTDDDSMLLGLLDGDEDPVPAAELWGSGALWPVDVDGDGALDLMGTGGVISWPTGEFIRALPHLQRWQFPVSADLDLDGDMELLGAVPVGGDLAVGIIDDDGAIPSPCVVEPDLMDLPRVFAIGELDGDAEGEFVVATNLSIAICDSDGSLIRQTPMEINQWSSVGLGDLDGDGVVEIIFHGADYEPDLGIVGAMDLDLEILWQIEADWYSPFSLADLDGDGDHEVVVSSASSLWILDGDGSLLSSWDTDEDSHVGGWRAQPVVLDVDGDGLAEIVRPGMDTIVLDTATGGFPAPGATSGWSGADHFPGMLGVDGNIDRSGTHWLTPGFNGWNAHPVCLEPDE